MLDNKTTFQDDMEARLNNWGRKLDEMLEGLARGNGDGGRLELINRLNESRKDQERATAKLDELKISSGERWEELREGMERTWEDMEKFWRSRFPETPLQ